MKLNLKEWKVPVILLGSLGIASIGDFIYLIAINIIVYQMTGSAAAVAGLWVVSPLTNIVTKFWTGSFIDYRSKKNIVVVTFILRAAFIAMIPFAATLFAVYTILVLLSIAKSFFGPASMTYVAVLVSPQKRKRFNSLWSFTSSGAFIIGPAIGGSLILLTNISVTLWLNAGFFLVAALLLILLPETEKNQQEKIPALTLSQVAKDFTVVFDFMNGRKYVSVIYLGFLTVMLFSFAMDAQEVVFTQQVIGLSEIEYSLLISITGIGSVSGALLLSLFANKISIRYMIVIGMLMMTAGYVVYAFSWSFASVTVGFVILGFFNVFVNAGIMTFYQNNVPVSIMGRVTSIFGLIQSFFQIFFILAIGLLADFISLKLTIGSLAIIMLITTVLYTVAVLNPKYSSWYEEEERESQEKLASING
ncbi:major facilitator (MFS) superfamily protein [Planococcus antarcticus DSM 14505]|uniref:MFS transporter n=1 Tax=Planococcus antarcticus DSM 14505 TaxID=1185653 RepID=A0A1C7DHQ7_9BACL|nr:MFS transporter [Planococcus antarcticus]ANU10733.1 MFS transporter [Planococcus antarcticus DSM 14505]EIM06826.1 major facilitator (MFS) superfamily protein [Planococcus antarcticus DSM 14505]